MKIDIEGEGKRGSSRWKTACRTAGELVSNMIKHLRGRALVEPEACVGCMTIVPIDSGYYYIQVAKVSRETYEKHKAGADISVREEPPE